MGGWDAVQIGVPQQRLIGAPAMALWRHLVDTRGCGDRVMSVSLIRVSTDTGIPHRTLDRALARLSVAGAVERWRSRERRGAQWVSRLDLRVYGGIDTTRDEEIVWMPSPVMAWCDTQPGWGGARVGRQVGASGTDHVVKLAFQDAENQPLTDQGGAPKISQSYQGEQFPFPNGKGSDAEHRVPSPVRMIKAAAIDSKNLPKTAVKGSTLTGDPQDRATRHQWIRQMAAAYNTACQEVFGVPGRCYPPAAKATEFSSWDPVAGAVVARPEGPDDGGALEKWRAGKVYLYDKLLGAAHVLADKSIAPIAWARWCMEGSRDAQKAEGKTPTPRPILAVFAESVLADPRRRAMFYQHNSGQYGHEVQPTTQHLEQLYRMQEARRRAKGWTYLWGLPTWYVAMRETEIAQGVLDPMDRFPVILGGAK